MPHARMRSIAFGLAAWTCLAPALAPPPAAAGATSRGARFVARQVRRALDVRRAAREATELHGRLEAARARVGAPAWPGVAARGTSTAPVFAPATSPPAPAKE